MTPEKKRGIPDAEVKQLSGRLVSQLFDHNMLGAKATLRHITKMPLNGQKIIRFIYKELLNSRYGLGNLLRMHDNTRRDVWSTSVILPIVLEKLTTLIIEEDKRGNIRDGKFLTLPKWNYELLALSPEVTNYLFENERVIPGKNFKISEYNRRTSSISESITSLWFSQIRTLAQGGTNVKNYGIDLTLYADQMRLRSLLVNNINKNLSYFLEKFGDDYSEIASTASIFLVDEFTRVNYDAIDERYLAHYENRGVATFKDIPKIPSSDYPAIKAFLRKNIFDGINKAFSALSPENTESKDVFEKHNLNLERTSLFIEEARKL